MEWKCLHVEERARREVMSLLDWKMCRSNSLARSVMCIFVVLGGFLKCIIFYSFLDCFVFCCCAIFSSSSTSVRSWKSLLATEYTSTVFPI